MLCEELREGADADIWVQLFSPRLWEQTPSGLGWLVLRAQDELSYCQTLTILNSHSSCFRPYRKIAFYMLSNSCVLVLLKLLFYYYLPKCLPACMFLHNLHQFLRRPEEGKLKLDCGELPSGCWESNLDLLEEQSSFQCLQIHSRMWQLNKG